MLELKKIAITGGLSSGKSTVCQLFKAYGAYVLSSDDIVHQLLSPNSNLSKRVINLLGQDIAVSHGTIDRRKVAEKVFQETRLLDQLEELIHPEVKAEISRQYECVRKLKEYLLFVVEVPLLYEAGFESFFHNVVVVTADEDIAKKRYLEHGGEEEAFQKRMARQLSLCKKAQKGCFVIENNGTREELALQVLNLFKRLIQ